jgi:serine protease Do
MYDEGAYNGGGKKPSTNKLLNVLLIIIMVAVIAVSSVGIYKWLGNEGTAATIPSQSVGATSQETTQGSSSSSAANISGYNLDVLPSEVAAKVIPSVVCIQNYQQATGGNFWGMGYSASEEPALYAEGSGIVYSSDGYIITNAHVVEGATLLKVVLSSGDTYEATLVGKDEDTDLALIKVDATGLTVADLGDAESLAVGDFVLAVGNPGGLEFSSSVAFGIVSAKDRPLEIEGGYTMDTIQTDAAINPGNSGGALVNMKGQVVGICSAKYVATGYEGLGFAITINEALPIIKDLQTYGSVQNRSMLGVGGMIIDSLMARQYNMTEGFYIKSISNSSAGDLASGDIITAIDGNAITSQSDIKNAIQNKTPGAQIAVEYWRNGKTASTTLTLLAVA